MLPSQATLDGLHQLTPLQQGDLSNLCGVYSVLNAVQLACWRVPPKKHQLRELLNFGIRHLTKRRLLARVIASGMDDEIWLELRSALVYYSNEILPVSLTVRPFGRNSGKSSVVDSVAIAPFKRAISKGHPILCRLGGALDHYTVVAGYSTHRVMLFDSTGLRWIKRRSIGWSEQSGDRYWLDRETACAIVDTW